MNTRMSKQQLINEATFLANHAGQVERILRKHRMKLLGGEGMTELDLPLCNKMPRGWQCTRPKGHTGKCTPVAKAADKEQKPTVRGWLADQVLAFLQKRCKHPGSLVSVDILEGCVSDLQVTYCNRCGSVKTDWNPTGQSKFTILDHTWRRPDPNLWRGR